MTGRQELLEETLSLKDSCSQNEFAELLSLYNPKSKEFYFDIITSSKRTGDLKAVFKPFVSLNLGIPKKGVAIAPTPPKEDISLVYGINELIDWALKKELNLPESLKKRVETDRHEDNVIKQQHDNALLVTLGAILDLVLSKEINTGLYRDQAHLINKINDKFGETRGLSESQLQKQFASAKKALNSAKTK